MGCIVCRYKPNYNESDLQIQEDRVTSAELLTKSMKNEHHNLVRESPPCHIKLAMERGDQFKAKTFGYKREGIKYKKKYCTLGSSSNKEIAVKQGEMKNALSVIRRKKYTHFRPIKNQYIQQCNPLDPNIIVTPETLENSVLFDSQCLVVEKKGSIYDEYKVVDVIGRGSFGVVNKVTHRTNGKPYALKIIKKSFYQNKNFMNEMEILKKLVSALY